MKKSFGAQNEVIQKSLDVSDFLEALVDEVGNGLRDNERTLVKSIDRMISKSVSDQQSFNVRIAKALHAIGTAVQSIQAKQNELNDLTKSFADAPAMRAPQRKSILSKSDIAASPLDADTSQNISRADIENWLVEKASSGAIALPLVTQFELAHGDINVLPVQVRKALLNDLAK